MEPIFSLLAGAALFFAGPALGAYALIRVRRTERRLDALLDGYPTGSDQHETWPDLSTTSSASLPSPELASSPPRPAAPTVTPAAAVLADPTADHDTETPPPPPPPKVTPKVTPKPRHQPIDWERWLGVRGAALLGGVALALSGLFFAQYAIQHGWFGPTARITCGGILGLLLLLARGGIARFTTDLVADVLAGAGTVMGYASAWAAWKLHGLIPIELALPWMAALTCLACLQSVRHQRQVVGIFGLIGGFATPLLLETWTVGPIGLFGYLLLIDLAVLALARRTGWAWLAPLALGSTTLLQGLWTLQFMEARHTMVGLVAALGFGLLFAVSASQLPRGSSSAERALISTRRAGMGIAALFALHFARRADLDIGIIPLAGLLLVYAAIACRLARRQVDPLLRTMAAVMSVTVLSVWLGISEPNDHSLVRFALAVSALAALFCVEARRQGSKVGADWILFPQAALALFSVSSVAVLILATARALPTVQVDALALGGAVQLGLLSLGLARRYPLLPVGLALLLGTGLATVVDAAGTERFFVIAYTAAAGIATLSLVGARQQAWLGATAPAVITPLLLLAPGPIPTQYPQAAAALCLLTGLASLGARTARSTPLLGLVVIASAVGATRMAWEGWGDTLLLWSLAPLVTLLAPLARRPRTSELWVAAASPLLWFNPIMLKLAREPLGTAQLLGVLACAPAALALIVARPGRGMSSRQLAPLFASASILLCFALAYLLGVDWLTVGLVLAGLSTLAVANRTGERLLFTVGSALQICGAAGLLVVALIPGHFPSSLFPPGGAIGIAYGLGALALAGGALLQRGERREHLSVRTLGLGSSLLIFAWISLAIADGFRGGNSIVFELARHEARDLTLSIAWAVYALVLLGLGTVTKVQGLRRLSLGFTLLTVGKVFLVDLGELEGLYRIASMAGLAISLLAVSLLYQRVVFRTGPSKAEEGRLEEPC